MDAATDIKTLLTSITSNVFIDYLPDTPDDLIAIFSDGGMQPEYTFGNGNVAMHKPALNILCRSTLRSTVVTYMGSIKTALSGKTNQSLNGTTYKAIIQDGDIINLGRDQNDRIQQSLKFRLYV
jgi:hypothetical protein